MTDKPSKGMLNRRRFLALGAVAGGAALAPLSYQSYRGLIINDAFADGIKSPRTRPFISPLPIPPEMSEASRFQAPDCEESDDPQARFFQMVEEAVPVRIHPDLPPTMVWRYRDANTPSATYPYGIGPTFRVRMGEQRRPIIVRHFNGLPNRHVGFAVPYSTVHLHGIHAEARSDGFPEAMEFFDPIFRPGKHYDYCYPMRDPGFSTGNPDPVERPSTLWYHDHYLDHTGPNVYRGLAGFYLVFDELDTGNEHTGLRLPSGPYDIPLMLSDKLFARDGSLVYLPGSHDGFLGDKMLVNGAIQPYLKVKARKYRFRILNASNARFYRLFLKQDGGPRQTFDMIATGGGLLSQPLRDRKWMQLGMAERGEIVIDFSKFPSGTELYLENRIDQPDGRGPGGDYLQPTLVQGRGDYLMKFIVGEPEIDPSEVPDTLRPFAPISTAEIRAAKKRELIFKRHNGVWSINNQFIDVNKPMFTSPLNGNEVWTLKNGGGGWWHPVHIHLEFMRVLKRNGKKPPLWERDGIGRTDTVSLSGTDEARVFLRFRDFPGPFVFHCHNLEHEDMFMMARFDVA